MQGQEKQADAYGAKLFGDTKTYGEALTKTHILNLQPVKWPVHYGSRMSHPSLIDRLKAIGYELPAEFQKKAEEIKTKPDPTARVLARILLVLGFLLSFPFILIIILGVIFYNLTITLLILELIFGFLK